MVSTYFILLAMLTMFPEIEQKARELEAQDFKQHISTEKLLSTVLKKIERLDDNFHCVETNKFYRCAQLTPDHLEQYIKEHGIKTIINLRGVQENQTWWIDEKNVAKRLNVEHFDIEMTTPSLPSITTLKNLFQLFDTAQLPILVHCYAGVDRSGLTAALWQLDKNNKTTKEALKQLSATYQYIEELCPAKRFFIELWQGRTWALENYNPKHYDFPLE